MAVFNKFKTGTTSTKLLARLYSNHFLIANTE